MSQPLRCLRCDTPLQHMGREKLQLGQTGFLLGDWPNLLAGALPVDLYHCPQCGKLELYLVGQPENQMLPQRQCPRCGRPHDVDYPKCPHCKYDYYAK